MQLLSKKLLGVIGGLYLLLMIYITVTVVMVSPRMSFPCKTGAASKNLPMLAVAAVCLLAAVFVFQSRSVQRKCMELRENVVQKFVFWGCIAFCIFQIYACFNYYFLTGWDVGLIHQSAMDLANGTYESPEQFDGYYRYYSMYPNNMELLGVFVACMKINQYFGVLDPENGVMVFIVLNCVIMAVTGYLLYQVIARIFSHRWGLLGWLLFVLFIGMSPWVSIPYSDSLGLLFPTLELYLFLRLRSSDRKWIYSILLGIVGGIGYHLKPQTFIMLIAICVVALLNGLAHSAPQSRRGRAILLAVLCVGSVWLASFVPKAITSALEIRLDPNKTFGSAHFVMMGMNPERRGIYSQEDCDFSYSFDDTVSRRQGELAVIKERLKQLGAGGYFYLLNQKLLTTYGDGTFAWGFEGSFWKEIPPLKNSGVSALLRDFYYYNGTHFSAFVAYMQCLWVFILFLACFSFRKQNPAPLTAVQLGVIGLTMFELLFESRARYLYTFSPLFILLAVCGARNIFYAVSHCLRRDSPDNRSEFPD